MDITDLRKQIDEVDSSLIRLFSQRMDLASNIAKYKHEHDLPVFVPAREQDILRSVSERSRSDLDRYIRTLYSMLFELSRSYQKEHILQISSGSDMIQGVSKSANRLKITSVISNEYDALFKVAAKQSICGVKVIRLDIKPFTSNSTSLTIEIDNSGSSVSLEAFLRELKEMSESFSIFEYTAEVTT